MGHDSTSRTGSRQVQRAAALTLLLAGCGAAPPITPAGDGTLLITRQAATGFTGIGTMRADALREAQAHCAGQGKSFTVLDTRQTEGPYVMGNYPRVDITFRCT